MGTHTVLGYTEAKVKSKTCGYVKVTIIDVSGSFYDDYDASGSNILVEHIEVAKLLMPVTAGRNGTTFYPGGQPDIWGISAELLYIQGVGKVELRPRTAAGKYFDLLTNSANNTGIGFPGFLRDENGKYYPLWDAFYSIALDSPKLYSPVTEFEYGYYHNPDSTKELNYNRKSADIKGFQRRLTWAHDAMVGALIGEETDPYSGLNGDSDLPGGSSVPIPQLPTLSATAAGIIGIFAPTQAEMRALADYMWTDFNGGGSTIENYLKEISQGIKRLTADPLDYILGLNIIPSQGLTLGGRDNIRFGFLGITGVSMQRLASQYFVVNCGTIFFDTVCGGTFLDYAPYSKFSLYLPYVGFVDVDPNDFVGHAMGVIYHCDVISGAVVAYVTKDDSVMYQYSGNCAVNIPLSSDNWGNTFAAAVKLVDSINTPAAIPGVANEGTKEAMRESNSAKRGIASTAASVASNPSLLSPTVRHSGAVAGTAGAMGVQVPFVIREAVAFHSTSRFNTLNGYPSYYFRKLSDISGFTTVIGVHIEGSSATAEEIAEIEELLIGGVIL